MGTMDLKYPVDKAPMIPKDVAEVPVDCDHVVEMQPARGFVCEIFPIVASDGTVIGRASRDYCHSGAKPLHPVVHLHIIDKDGRIYLQKRSMTKDIQPGKWDTAVGGHISYGEKILDALYRESSEELNLSGYTPVYIKSYVFESKIEKELVNVFATVGSFEPRPDLDEVDEGRWWQFEQVEAAYGKEILTPNFENEFKDIRKQLEDLL